MKFAKRITSIALAAVTAMSLCNVQPFLEMQTMTAFADSYSDEAQYGDYLWYKNVDEDEDGIYDYVEITDCDEAVTSVEIPAEIDGLPVTSIGDWSFDSCLNLTSITIPDSVTSIGYSAFNWCESLENITIPESITEVEDGAFSDTPWLEAKQGENPLVIINDILIDGKTCSGDIIIPDGVTCIADSAFYYNEEIKSVIIPDSVTSIGSSAFSSCESLESITIPDSITVIEIGTFQNCDSLTSIVIPDSVTSIGDYAFYSYMDESVLENVVIPDNVEYIGMDAFKGTLLYNNQTGVKYADKWVIGCDEDVTSVKLKDGTIGVCERAFCYCDELESVEFPDSVAYIGESAFISCDSLKSVVIPDNVKTIEYSTFSSCDSLESVIIPDGVTTIEDSAFSECNTLKNIILPDSVEYVGSSFCWSGLKNIVVGAKVEAINLARCEYLESIVVSEDNEYYTSVDGVLYDKEQKTLISYPSKKTDSSYIIPDTVTIISSCAFEYSIYLESISIPETVSNIGEGAFNGCTELEYITISENVTIIPALTFSFCQSLKEIIIPASVTKIEARAFCECTELVKVVIMNPECEIKDISSTFSNGSTNDYDHGYFNGTIYGYSNSTAQAYAEKYSYAFESLGDAPTQTTTAVTTAPVVTTTTTAATTPSSDEIDWSKVKYGDVNLDNEVAIADIAVLSKYVTASELYSLKNATAVENSDVNHDSSITSADVQKLIEFILKTITSLD